MKEMNMKRILLFLVLLGIVPLSLIAQDDDMYFVPKKETKAIENKKIINSNSIYHTGSERDIDEYNRRGRIYGYYQKIGGDSLGNDVIEFHEGDGSYKLPEERDTVYPGSVSYYDNMDYDYECIKNMGRFDGFYGWYDPYFYSFRSWPYWCSYYGVYDPWYYGWYGSWHFSSWYGWWTPHYHYTYIGWYPSFYRTFSGPTGTMNHSSGLSLASSGHRYGFSGKIPTGNRYAGSFGNRINSEGSLADRDGNYGFGGKRPSGNRNEGFGNRNQNMSVNNGNSNIINNKSNRNHNFGGRRNPDNNLSVSSPISRPMPRLSIGGGGIGNSRSGGGNFGGSRSGGFGGRR